jgi:hypothetical protein
MKLWHVVQWGNEMEGGNGEDTNCLVRAPDMEIALALAYEHFNFHSLGWKNGICDVIMLLGEDSLDDEAKVVMYKWKAHAFNPAKYPSWHRDPHTGEWTDDKTMFGDNIDQ